MRAITWSALRRLRPAVVLFAFGGAASGCFEIEETFRFERDFSGTAEVRVAGDFGPSVRAKAYRTWSQGGKPGEPPTFVIDGAVADASKAIDSFADPGYVSLLKAEGQKRLPEGIQLRDFSLRRIEKRAEVKLGFAFDHASKISNLQLAPGSDAPSESASNSPLAGFRFHDEGETVLLSLMKEEAVKPFADLTKGLDGGGGAPARQEETVPLELQRFSVRIEAPFEVVETNASRRDGKALIWEYDAETIAKTPPEVQAKGLWVRFKK